MAKYNYPGDSIECNGSEIISRKIIPSAFMEIIAIGKCKTYKCSLNSEATINKELPEPKTPIYKQTSHVNLGDILEGENISLAIFCKKNLKIFVVPYSGRHKAQKTITDCYTFAEITIQCKGIPKTPQIQTNR
ncbi:MAG: hypothetical protein WCH34_12260 [Bacteroidota bacterium]